MAAGRGDDVKIMSKVPLSPTVKLYLDHHEYRLCAALPWGKYLYQDEGSSVFVKVSSAETGMSLIRSEMKGLELLAPLIRNAVSVPEGTLLLDDSDGVILKMTRVNGVSSSKWFAARINLTPSLAKSQRTMSLANLLDKESTDNELAQFLIHRFGDVNLIVTPSHGDLIYWNVLVGSQRPGLVDFEYVSDGRVMGFDDLHYRLAPWLYRWMRWHLPMQLLVHWGRRQARTVCRKHDLLVQPELLLALFFVHWAAIRREWHPDFQPQKIGRVERWATLI